MPALYNRFSMKKIFLWGVGIVLFLGILFLRFWKVHAPDPYVISINGPKTDQVTEVDLEYCADGDTVYFRKGDEILKVRFQGIDAPEVAHEGSEDEPFALEAKERACSLVKNADHIYLETDPGHLYDRYGRILAWVFADKELVQERLVYEGYAEVKYLEDHALYRDELTAAQNDAKRNGRGIWKTGENE